MRLSGKWKSIWRSKWFFLLPSLIGVLAFFVFPFVQTLVRSLSRGLRGYASVLGNDAFRLAVFNTVRFVGVAIPLLLFISLLAALGIYKSKWMGLIKSAYLFPMAVPAAVVALIAKVIFAPSGMANQMLAAVGEQGLGWLSGDASFWTLVISYLWKNSGYTIVLWIAGIAAVPEHVMEAAKVDGASGGQCVWFILLPQLKPALYTITMLSFLNSFKVFREAYLLVGSYPPKSMYLLQHLFNNWYINLDIDKMSAAAVMLAAAFALCSVLLQQMWEKEECL